MREGQAHLLSRHAFTSALAELRYSALPSVSAPILQDSSSEFLIYLIEREREIYNT
jgi:hypothetical protein